MNTNDMIERARKLADLRNTTPGPWKTDGYEIFAGECCCVSVGSASEAAVVGTEGYYRISRHEREANAKLMASAPEMAALLEQLADRLEKLESWAHPRPEQFASQALAEQEGAAPVTEKLYAKRDPMALEPHFTRHMQAMTAEGLHEKGDIAIELAWRDAQIEQLEDRLRQVEVWARSMCEHTCDKWPAGKHAPNCPVVELSIEIENEK